MANGNGNMNDRGDGVLRVGIGFATGRKGFRRVLRSYLFNWLESGLFDRTRYRLELFVVYDLSYSGAASTDFRRLDRELLDRIDAVHLLGRTEVRREAALHAQRSGLSEEVVQDFFGTGYAAMRNMVLFKAIQLGMDCLLFLDDDEYPLAVTRTRRTAIWSGQQVLATHLKHILDADITNGRHCGYISPIPQIRFTEELTEDVFRRFIEALSNDIVTWDKIRALMDQGGVTYADTGVLVGEPVEEVQQVEGAKFISGANLCLNLTDPARIPAFYNPPGARGEDTFLSTLLADRTVLRLPCYAFHDGFSTYRHILDGVLPTALKAVEPDDQATVDRFLKACIGWIRYKPLFLHLTRPERFAETIARMREDLAATLPAVCAHFARTDFLRISDEFERYVRHVPAHAAAFRAAQDTWVRLVGSLGDRRALRPTGRP